MAGGSVFQVGEDVELFQVVVLLSALAMCLLVFETALHHLEHHLSRYDKYQHMLKKVYRELMILGLLSFIVKMLTEVGGLDGYSGTLLAFQVADLIIFILALVLIIQAILVLLLLRRRNRLSDRADLITTQDVVNALKASCAKEDGQPDCLYHLDEIYDQVGVFPVILIPLPLVLNTFVLQQPIFRYFVIIGSILHLDASTLGEVVQYFNEIIELRSEFATSLLQCFKEGGQVIGNLEMAIQKHDPKKSGLVEVDTIRSVLAMFGFRLTRFRFNSVVKILFELEGTKVESASGFFYPTVYVVIRR
ncbi:hypothetical protein BBJ29_004897 [Phytophthora kernoviae]|uniref:EF-hand domain-containing protein n=1 Tax=Phytophthora kernoviae TaxID=325452 RepID=A0A3F2RLP5_9STRA|nr:hypothetical protein BBJ29_004897 [Phytophthora kernoviae]RLN60025.1 hypothetical protein BBP00_00006188 [Phytophthora kernoviae]